MSGGLRFVALALGFALLFAAAGHLLLTVVLKEDANIWVSGLTAIIVGTFVALQMVARQRRDDAEEEEGAEGAEEEAAFEVTARRPRA